MKTLIGLAVVAALAYGGYRYWKGQQPAEAGVAAEVPSDKPASGAGPEVGRVRSLTGEVD